MKRKAKGRNKWRRYEAGKKALAARRMTPAAYEKACLIWGLKPCPCDIYLYIHKRTYPFFRFPGEVGY